MRPLLAIALLCACARRVDSPDVTQADPFHDLVVNEDDCEGAGPATTSHADVFEDLAVVERVLREGWAGYEQRAKEGVDWAATFASLRAGVDALPEPVPNDELRKYLAHGLEAARDNHLSFWWFDARGRKHMSSAGGHLDAWTTDGGAGEGAILARSPLRIERRALKLAAASPGPEWRRLIGGPRDASEKAFERIGGVLRVRTFDNARGPELVGFANAGDGLRDAGWAVIDLRGNQGGGDSPAIALAQSLSHEPLRGWRIDMLDSDVTRQGQLNSATCEAARPDLDREQRLELVKERDAYAAALPHAKLREWKVRTRPFEGQAPHTFAGPIVLLVDRRCTSSCESAVTIIRQLPGAVIVGENTAGTGVFGEVLEYRLPRSGLWMRAGTKWLHGWEEVRGVTPDWWIDDPDPVGLAIDLARCLAGPGCPITR